MKDLTDEEKNMHPDELRDKYDLWRDRLNIPVGGYNAAVDQDILKIAKHIIENSLKLRRNEPAESYYAREIAEKFGMSETHVELIQYILGSVKYDTPGGRWEQTSVFDYGIAPRGLFVGNEELAKRFIKDFEKYMYVQWERGEE